MAFKDKEIKNPRTGQAIRFLQTAKDTNGEFLEMESTYETHSERPPEHYHPAQDENFLVLEGELRVCVDGVEKTLRKGDHLHIARNVVHSMWNESELRAVVNWKVTPALDTEYLLETTAGLAREGKTSATGRPALLQVILLMNRFSGVFRLAGAPFPIQKMFFIFLSPLSYLMGYRSTYPRYLN